MLTTKFRVIWLPIVGNKRVSIIAVIPPRLYWAIISFTLVDWATGSPAGHSSQRNLFRPKPDRSALKRRLDVSSEGSHEAGSCVSLNGKEKNKHTQSLSLLLILGSEPQFLSSRYHMFSALDNPNGLQLRGHFAQTCILLTWGSFIFRTIYRRSTRR